MSWLSWLWRLWQRPQKQPLTLADFGLATALSQPKKPRIDHD